MRRLLLLLFVAACTPTKVRVDYDDRSVTADPVGSNSSDDDTDSTPPDADADDEEPDPPDPDDDDDDDDEPVPEDWAEWTLMVYLNGDNDLEEAALVDLNEMERVGSTDQVHLLVQLDRHSGYVDWDGDWFDARRYRITSDDNDRSIGSPVVDDVGPVDSGRPEAYIDFVAWAVEHYPAKRYGLVIWDHGWGWTLVPTDPRKGVSNDDRTGNALSIAGGDLTEILVATKELTGDRLSLLGMDACLMANWETARIAAPYADVYVASQATESLLGWAYDTAYADLLADPEMNGAELGEVIAQRFNEIPDATQSVIDLEALVAMDGAIDAFAAAVLDLDTPRAAVVSHARDTQIFDGTYPDRDLGDFVLRLADSAADDTVVQGAEDVWDELGEAIVANYTHGGWVHNATGLSIYIPTRGMDESYSNAAWADLTLWDEMLETIQH